MLLGVGAIGREGKEKGLEEKNRENREKDGKMDRDVSRANTEER